MEFKVRTMEEIVFFLKQSVLDGLIGISVLLSFVARTRGGASGVEVDCDVKGVLKGFLWISLESPYVWQTASADSAWRKHFHSRCVRDQKLFWVLSFEPSQVGGVVWGSGRRTREGRHTWAEVEWMRCILPSYKIYMLRRLRSLRTWASVACRFCRKMLWWYCWHVASSWVGHPRWYQVAESTALLGGGGSQR